jgi:hypothetical protein
MAWNENSVFYVEWSDWRTILNIVSATVRRTIVAMSGSVFGGIRPGSTAGGICMIDFLLYNSLIFRKGEQGR